MLRLADRCYVQGRSPNDLPATSYGNWEYLERLWSDMPWIAQGATEGSVGAERFRNINEINALDGIS